MWAEARTHLASPGVNAEWGGLAEARALDRGSRIWQRSGVLVEFECLFDLNQSVAGALRA